MTGRLVDLTLPSARLPEASVVDASVVVARLIASGRRDSHRFLQAAELFRLLRQEDRRVVLTPTGFRELLHVAIRARYEHILRTERESLLQRYGTRVTSWTELFKRDPIILLDYADELAQFRRQIIADGLVIAEPMDLAALPDRRSYNDTLVRLIGRFGLDSGDASILLEAQCLGLNAIVTMDQDLQRALPDFDIYTWLS